jgi:hypothetical protein
VRRLQASSGPTREWVAGKCSIKACPMTLVTYVGAGQWWCWLHALAEGLV